MTQQRPTNVAVEFLANAKKKRMDQLARSHHKRSSRLERSGYNVKWLPATANRMEGLFSRAKLTVGDLRASMTPLNLEGILFLHANKRFWDESVIQSLLN